MSTVTLHLCDLCKAPLDFVDGPNGNLTIGWTIRVSHAHMATADSSKSSPWKTDFTIDGNKTTVCDECKATYDSAIAAFKASWEARIDINFPTAPIAPPKKSQVTS